MVSGHGSRHSIEDFPNTVESDSDRHEAVGAKSSRLKDKDKGMPVKKMKELLDDNGIKYVTLSGVSRLHADIPTSIVPVWKLHLEIMASNISGSNRWEDIARRALPRVQILESVTNHSATMRTTCWARTSGMVRIA